jgi:hypothetical protein
MIRHALGGCFTIHSPPFDGGFSFLMEIRFALFSSIKGKRGETLSVATHKYIPSFGLSLSLGNMGPGDDAYVGDIWFDDVRKEAVLKERRLLWTS